MSRERSVRIARGTLAPELRGTLKISADRVHRPSVTSDCGNSVPKVSQHCAHRDIAHERGRRAKVRRSIRPVSVRKCARSIRRGQRFRARLQSDRTPLARVRDDARGPSCVAEPPQVPSVSPLDGFEPPRLVRAAFGARARACTTARRVRRIRRRLPSRERGISYGPCFGARPERRAPAPLARGRREQPHALPAPVARGRRTSSKQPGDGTGSAPQT